jgi:hypothetical protein
MATIIAILIASVLLVSPTYSAEVALEYKVKAAYLLNFTRYVEWPTEAFNASDSPLVICVLGADPFGSVLDKTISNKSSQGRRVVVQRFHDPSRASGACQLIFISQSEQSRESELLKTTSGKPILTIGESSSFLQRGGIINLGIFDEIVRFDVNLRAAEAAQLKLSARMLPLARKMEGGF